MSDKEGFHVENKEAKKFSDLTVFTTTFYGLDQTSQVRQKLAEKFIRNCSDLGINCVVVDGGSNQEFLDRVRLLKNVTLLVEPSFNMGESRRAALRLAMDTYKTLHYLWAEPEKGDLITENSLLAIIKELRDNKADIIVPQRAGFETLPDLQAWIEQRANKRATKIMDQSLNENLDLWFGPKMFNQTGASYFVNYKGKLDKWDSIIKPVIDAYKGGLRISSAEVDYKYDISQKKDEESNETIKRKRLEQYATILKELKDPYWFKDKPLENDSTK